MTPEQEKKMLEVATERKQKADKQGDEISFKIGDTFINYNKHSPKEQWQAIVLMLNAHGYSVVPQEQ